MTGPSGRPFTITDTQLNAILGNAHAPTPVPAGTADEINAVVGLAGISAHLELAHFIGQFTYECGYFRHYEEGNMVPGQYEFRVDLGNTQPGDGLFFRGRGACQLTGRANYEAFAKWLGQSNPGVMTNPGLVAQPPLRWLAAAYFWSTRPLLRKFADDDDVAGCTRVITGARVPGDGQGLAMRERLTDAAIMVLG